MSEGTPAPGGQQDDARWSVADLLTLSRLPVGLAFVLVVSSPVRLGLLTFAALSDVADGWLARRLGPSRLGALLDPVADKLFMGMAFGALAWDGWLTWPEAAGCLFRDFILSMAFFVRRAKRMPISVPSRWSGKSVTFVQVATLASALVDTPLTRPLALVTTLLAGWSVWDYQKLTGVAEIRLGRADERSGGRADG
ncbi:MAG: CDP-alcohol phosphatidyltransferase family protein [Gemmatimonadales bacterium]|nr:CDP-alcohol phosphatidyltransferase family protein [Gemmatimonadales bacterium]